MKITAIEIKPGMIIEHKNDYWNVLKTQHVKPGKGGAFNQVELKSVIKGTKLNERFRSSEAIEKAEVNEKKFNFLYIDGENCHFMDNKNFEKVEKYYNFFSDLKLLDYKVRILNTGTEATTRVLIESTDKSGISWFTVGVSPNIIEASFRALVDSLDYKLFKDNAPASN